MISIVDIKHGRFRINFLSPAAKRKFSGMTFLLLWCLICPTLIPLLPIAEVVTGGFVNAPASARGGHRSLIVAVENFADALIFIEAIRANEGCVQSLDAWICRAL